MKNRSDVCSALKPKRLIHQDYLDPAFFLGKARHKEIAANGIRRLAVGTGSIHLARSLSIWEALGIDWGRNVPDPIDSMFHILCHLVHTDNHKDLLRTVGNAGNAVRIPVKVHKDAIFRNGIRT